MELHELAFACYLYNNFSKKNDTPDADYINFLKAVNHRLDIENSEHRISLIKWLNHWGCRQFATKAHSEASERILNWSATYKKDIPSEDKNLWELNNREIEGMGELYDSLKDVVASRRKRQGGNSDITIGPTGAAKILFAIRPNIAVPWDEAIRKDFEKNARDKHYKISYSEFLCIVIKEEIKELLDSCNRNGVEMLKLPMKLGRENSTIPKLIDEYYWVKITRKCPFPEKDRFKSWIDWFNRDASKQKCGTSD